MFVTALSFAAELIGDNKVSLSRALTLWRPKLQVQTEPT